MSRNGDEGQDGGHFLGHYPIEDDLLLHVYLLPHHSLQAHFRHRFLSLLIVIIANLFITSPFRADLATPARSGECLV
uniref:Uncharacterized protein n=1 Tax=Marmota marmota marmota TaxID=9994 RepID=A0A8C5ZRW5_MARMA